MPSSFRNLLDGPFENKPIADILAASPAALRGVSARSAGMLKDTLGIRTIAQMAENRYFQAARALQTAGRRPGFDPGPPDSWLETFEQAPIQHYVQHPTGRFRFEFGPVYYRGRLDGTARVLVIGQDPATDELLAHRAFVGFSGQRVQGLLAKLGLTRSYVMFNAFLFSVHGQFDRALQRVSLEPEVANYRHRCLDQAASGNPLEAVITFGAGARHASENWPGRGSLPVFHLAHPAASNAILVSSWNGALSGLAAAIDPDPDGTVDTTPFGRSLTKADIRPIPRFDLPFGIPSWHGTGGGGSSSRDGNSRIIWDSPLP